MRSGQLAWPPHTHRGAHGSARPGHRPGLPSGLPLCDPSVSRPGLCSSRSLHAATCHCACPQWTPPDLCTLHCIPAAGVPPHWLSWPPHCWATQHTEDRGVLLGFPSPWPSPCPPALALLANPLCLSWALATGPVTQNLALSTPGQAESWHQRSACLWDLDALQGGQGVMLGHGQWTSQLSHASTQQLPGLWEGDSWVFSAGAEAGPLPSSEKSRQETVCIPGGRPRPAKTEAVLVDGVETGSEQPHCSPAPHTSPSQPKAQARPSAHMGRRGSSKLCSGSRPPLSKETRGQHRKLSVEERGADTAATGSHRPLHFSDRCSRVQDQLVCPIGED